MKYQDMSVLGSYGRYQYQHRIRNDGGVTAAAISAGAALTSAGASVTMAGKMNKRAAREARRTREWQTKERLAQQEYQQQMYQRQLEDTIAMRDYDNEWNSLQAQKQRALDAGFSPLSVLGMSGANGTSDANLSAAPGVPSDPGGTLPQMFNPLQEASALSGSFAEFANALTQREAVQNQAIGIKADAEYKRKLGITEDAMREGKVILQNVNIDVGESVAKLNGKKAEEVAASIVKCNKEIEVADKYMVSMGVDMDYKQFQMWLQKQNYNLEERKVGSRIALELSTRNRIDIQNRMLEKYEKDNYGQALEHERFMMSSQDWNENVKNQQIYRFVHKGYSDESQDLEMRTKRAAASMGEYQVKLQLSDFGVSWTKSFSMLKEMTGVIGAMFTAYSQYAVGQAGLARSHQIMNSVQNSGNIFQPMNQTEYNPFGF